MSFLKALADGGVVSPITVKKFLKDFIADFLMSAAAALVSIQVVSVEQATAQPMVVVFAVSGALIAAAYRAVLRWATSE